MTSQPIWYVLYSGSSEDGRGPGVYWGRTTSTMTALTFYRKNIKNNPHSTGRVVGFTDGHEIRFDEDSLKEMIKQDNRAAGIEKRRATLAKKKAEATPAHYGRFA